MKSKLKIIIAAIVLFFLTSSVASAAIVTCGQMPQAPGATVDPCTLTDLVIIVMRITNFFLGISWILALFFIFWGGYNLASSAGNEEKMKNAKADFRNGVIGFFII